MIKLERTKRTDSRLLKLMSRHYSKPKGFVGRNRCFAIYYDGVYYGHTVGGSATLYLDGRDEFFNLRSKDDLVHIINNIFYHVERVNGEYPIRNFTTAIVQQWRKTAREDWEDYYGDKVWGYETLVQLPRSGELYRRDDWQKVGKTTGYTCKRTGGVGTDDWTGRRVWNTKELKPKWVFCKHVSDIK